MNMSGESLIILACTVAGVLFAVLEVIVIAAAYLIGKQDGYWTRVEAEKSARGIR